MKYFLSLFIGALITITLYSRCSNLTNTKDDRDTINTNIDSSKTDEKKYQTNSSPDEDSFELTNIYNSYLHRYNDSVKIDTSFIISKSNVKLSFRFYCMHDSALIVPDKYTEIYGIKGFVTHTFESSLEVKINDKPVLDTIIRKSIFEDTISVELKKYGVLMSPYLSFNNNQVAIKYSISIPLTDVGDLVSFPIINSNDLK